jgi:ABC-type uncharacterized transport system permease subunit
MTDTKPRVRTSRITRFLIPVSWTLWGILLLVLLWAFVDSIANPVYTPEVSPQVAPMVMGALLIVFVGFGLLLRWATRRRSSGCLIALTLMLAYVFFMLIAILVFEAWNDWQIEREISRFGERWLQTATVVMVSSTR